MKAQLIKETKLDNEIWWQVRVLNNDGTFHSLKCFNDSFVKDGLNGEQRARKYFDIVKNSTEQVGEEIIEEYNPSTNQTT